MFGILLTLLILDGILMTVVVLLQSGKGGGLAAVGGGAGTETFIGGRQAATLLTRATWVTGGIFLFLALVLSVMSSRREQPESVLQGEFQTAPAPQPVLPGLQTEQGQGEGAAAGAPAQTPQADTQGATQQP
ncbi:MAG TPA: preprotein translocase subunit SecG [Longimicrobiales bacterium]